MAEYRTSAHAIFDIEYHFEWITKYAVSPDHVRMPVSAPPQLAHIRMLYL
jgi:REP element-mobilizing transposase RayT